MGYRAARVAMVNSLGTIKANLGSLKRVKRFIKLLGIVNCLADFVQQPEVANGPSDCSTKSLARMSRCMRDQRLACIRAGNCASKSKQSWNSSKEKSNKGSAADDAFRCTPL
jgi:YjgF/chorismate_mutase-like, putative endoribonuclease